MFVRLSFWAAIAFTFVMATLPQPPALPGEPSDKVQHILAFVVLTVMGTAAHQEPRSYISAIGLLAFGALIEVVQAYPPLHRSSDVRDWIADAAAVSVTFGLITGLRVLQSRSSRNVDDPREDLAS
jgi:VanZ family protein